MKDFYKKPLFWVVVVIILIIIFWNKISSVLGLDKSGRPANSTGAVSTGTGGRLSNKNQLSSILAEIQSSSASSQEKTVISNLINNLYSTFGLTNINNLDKYNKQIADGYINDAKNKLSSSSKITTTDNISVLNKSCNAAGAALGCHGSWGSGIFGFCFHWGCNI